MKNIIKLTISDHEYLKAIADKGNGLNQCPCCDYFYIYYVNTANNIDILFGSEESSSFYHFFESSTLIDKLLQGKKINEDDLGLKNNSFFQSIITESDALSYGFFSKSSDQLSAASNGFMYNDKDGNIIFEISPFYDWTPEQKDQSGYITFEEFLKEYKPLVKTEIPKESIIKWIAQIKELNK